MRSLDKTGRPSNTRSPLPFHRSRAMSGDVLTPLTTYFSGGIHFMNIRTILSSGAFLVGSLTAGSALATRTGVGVTILDVTIAGSHARVTFNSAGMSGTVPTCHNAGTNAFGINLTTDKGKAQFSLAMSALLAGRTLNVAGTNGAGGTCVTSDSNAQEFVQ